MADKAGSSAHGGQSSSSSSRGENQNRSNGHGENDSQNMSVFSTRDPMTNFVVFVALVVGLLRWSMLPKSTC